MALNIASAAADHREEHVDSELIIGFAAFGVDVSVTAPASLRDEVIALLPTGWRRIAPSRARFSVALARSGDDWIVTADRTPVTVEAGLPAALGALDAQIRARIALHAPEFVFVHAGVVGFGGRVIVLPGFSLAGKTTLVGALIRAGAEYYSDEFAVVDAVGMIHPYPKPLSVRREDGDTVDAPAASLGATTATEPAPVGLIALTTYSPGASFAPQPLSAGTATLEMLRHTVPARTRPAQAMAFIGTAALHACAWETPRPEATPTARAIIDSLPWTD
jgi:hypothetical protein